MTIATGTEIRRRLDPGCVADQRLVITPLLSEEQVKDSQASVDLRLGSLFRAVRKGQTTTVDLDSDTTLSFDSTYVRFGQKYVIHPGQFVLAETFEFVHLPNDLAGYVVTRSSWGRLGLTVATAVGIHPQFAGVITLELRNLGDVPVQLAAGSKILQLFLHHAAPPISSGAGTYRGSTETTLPAAQTEDALRRYQQRSR